MTGRCPAIVVAGTQSGVGKTSVALGLTRALKERGLGVQPFKVGPDFLDPTWLSLAAGRTCYNLDPWMSGRDYVKELYVRATAGADLAIIEGVMGLHDGVFPDRSEGSTADVAALLGTPVLLVVNAGGMARSIAAEVKGYAELEPGLRIVGVIANQCGSEGHKRWLAESLRSASLPPILGAISPGGFPELPGRHLGLVAAQRGMEPQQDRIGPLAEACRKHVDLDLVMRLAQAAEPVNVAQPPQEPPDEPGIRIGVADDAAFHFYYPDNLEALAARGAEIVPFSPLADARLPSGLDALYLGGGYPEEHAEALAHNEPMRRATASFAASGRPVYAECGGLMYLAERLETLDGRRLPMAGVLPAATRMLARRLMLRYVEATLLEDGLWGARGEACRGHEFHYSELVGAPDAERWQAAYALRRPDGASGPPEGWLRGNILASYVHLHFASRPQWMRHFLKSARRREKGQS